MNRVCVLVFIACSVFSIPELIGENANSGILRIKVSRNEKEAGTVVVKQPAELSQVVISIGGISERESVLFVRDKVCYVLNDKAVETGAFNVRLRGGDGVVVLEGQIPIGTLRRKYKNVYVGLEAIKKLGEFKRRAVLNDSHLSGFAK